MNIFFRMGAIVINVINYYIRNMKKILCTSFLFLSLTAIAQPVGDCVPYSVLYGDEIIFDLNQKPILETIKSDLMDSDLLGNIPSFNLFKTSTVSMNYPNGDLMVSFQNNPVITQGIQHIYYENGNLMTSIPYSNAMKSGTQKIYYNNGVLMASIPYASDLIDGELRSYYWNGNTKMRQLFNQGVPINMGQMYHQNGNLQLVQSYQNGVVDGVQTQYYGDGQTIQSVIPYENGLINGTVRLYYPDSVLLGELNFNNGKIVTNTCYTPVGQTSQLNAIGIYNLINGVRPIECPYQIENDVF